MYRPRILFSFLSTFLVLAAACGDDGASVDVGPGTDATAADSGTDGAGTDVVGTDVVGTDVVGTDGEGTDSGTDAVPPRDAGEDISGDAPEPPDGGVSDVPSADSGTDAGLDAGAACHGYTFGRDAVRIERVGRLPSMIGGDIPLGQFDATGASTTGTTTGTYRGTWVFESRRVLQVLEQITLSGAPPPETPRTFDYSASESELEREGICSSTRGFVNTYSVRSDGSGRTILQVRQGTIMFTYTLRP